MKRLIRDNPTAAMLLAFFIASCVFAYCPMWIKSVVIAALFLFILFAFIIPCKVRSLFSDRKTSRAVLLMCSAVICASAVSLFAFDYYEAKINRTSGESESATFRIVDTVREYPYVSYYEAAAVGSDMLPRGTKVELALPYGSLEYGDVIKADVTYSSLSDNSTDVFDGRRYYLPRRVMVFAESEEAEKIAEDRRFSVGRFFDGIRDTLSSAIKANCRRETGGLAAAVLLGDKADLDASVKRDFRRIGISHLLVISGTHFSSLIALLEFAMRRMKIKQNIRAAVNMAFVLFFMALTGFTPSVIRAGIMHLLAQLSIIVARKPNTVNAYALSGAVILAVNPYAALDIGLQLSYAATLGCIVYLTERGNIRKFISRKASDGEKKRGNGFFRKIADGVLLTYTVTLFTLPLSWLYFGEISLVSIPVNLVAVPLVTGLLYLSAAFLVLYPLTVFIFPLSRLIDIYGGFVLSAASAVSHLSGVIVRIDFALAPLIIIPLVAAIVIFPFAKRKKTVAGAAFGLFVLLICAALLVKNADRAKTEFCYVPSGKNDGFVLHSDGKVLLCDMSNASVGYSRELEAEAEDSRASEIETVLLTHYHNKHISGFGSLCEREIVRNIILPSPSGEKERAVYNGLCDVADEYGVSVITLDDGELYPFGECEVSVYPRTALSRTSHPISGVKVVTHGEEIVLVSSSWNEGSEELAHDIGTAEYLFFGGHSPIYKKSFSLSNDGSAKLVSLSEDAAEFFSRESAEELGEEVRAEEKTKLEWK